MKSSAENKRFLFGLTQAEFLNFTIYLFYWKSSNLKIWRLSKNAQALVLATTCAIFYIQCCKQFLFHNVFRNIFWPNYKLSILSTFFNSANFFPTFCCYPIIIFLIHQFFVGKPTIHFSTTQTSYLR